MDEKEKESLYTHFEREIKSGYAEIEAKLEAASTLIKEAMAISEKTGTPFSVYMFRHSNTYIPKAYYDKHEEYEERGLDGDQLNEIADCYSEYDSVGWQNSSC